uniref:THUMP domain-containing protein n=1 Tax=Octactis speculum TaxID=3111310 RepID=A0A7S2GUE7_9STRA|mmetsp:Transcript_56580/g.77120  ORF Transcript_56580/g.77120 Transcript_56580/m.77120 type:complete len:134 (+) Transcript_56580:441-842(+)
MTASEALLTEHFGPSSPACSYMVAVKRRNNPTFDKDGLIRQLALAVNERHTVDLTAPQRVILIEVFQSLCGVSVVHKYPEFYSYNLRRFQEKLVLKEESSPGEAKAEETELTKESSGEAKVEETSPSDVVDGN